MTETPTPSRPPPDDHASYWGAVWTAFRRKPLAVAGLALIAALIVMAVGAPLIANDKPLYVATTGATYFPAVADYPGASLPAALQDINWTHWSATEYAGAYRDVRDLHVTHVIAAPIPHSHLAHNLPHRYEPPSTTHLLGTDDRGRDLAARMIWGSQISLSVGIVAMGIAIVIGLFIGALGGYFGGLWDFGTQRAVEIIICFPTFFLILAIMAYLPPSIYNIMFVIGLTGWTGIARLIRGEILKLRNQAFVEASRSLGASSSHTILRHLLPNAIPPVLVAASFGVAGAILTESALSYLGFGVPPPTASWGESLSQAQRFIDAWWLTLYPGLAIFLTVTAYNLVGDGLRDAIDPRLRGHNR